MLDLIAHAEQAGWSTRRACRLLDLDETRVARWRARREGDGPDGLVDASPGGGAVHGILDSEREAIRALYQAWKEVDRSHWKLAARGSRENLVHVSASTVQRVLLADGIVLEGNPRREPAPKPDWPDWLEWAPNRIWCYDFTHFSRAKRCVIAVLDVVSRYWLATLVSAEETSTQVEVCFLDALDSQGLLQIIDQRESVELQEALRSGDPDTIETVIAEQKDQVPLLLAVHASIGYVTPEDEHTGRGETVRQARRDGLIAARQARIDYRRSQQGNQP